jgi:probable rRNA maturation factor
MPLRVSVQRGAGATSGGGRDATGIVERATKAALVARGVHHAEVSVTLLGDRAIAALNAEWLQHDGPTDVIAFPLYEEGETPVGDVYIGIRQAARQAESHGLPLAEELARLAVHGTLHVLGFDHPIGADRVRSPMWREQERILAGLDETWR